MSQEGILRLVWAFCDTAGEKIRKAEGQGSMCACLLDKLAGFTMQILAGCQLKLGRKVLQTLHFLVRKAESVCFTLSLQWISSQCDLLQSVFKLQLYYKSKTAFSQSQAPAITYLSSLTTKTCEAECLSAFRGPLSSRSRTSHSAQLTPNPLIPSLQSQGTLFLQFWVCFNFSRVGPAENFYNKGRRREEYN